MVNEYLYEAKGDASGIGILYGAEVWGCGGQLRPVENVQMRAARIFLGVGRLHPLVSLQFEMNMLPVKWEAMKRSIYGVLGAGDENGRWQIVEDSDD